MRTGVTVSAALHAALLTIAIVGLGAAKPLEAPVVESIAVDLVPVTEFTNIRAGTLESDVVETETPSIVEDDKPAELAQPTGNTEEDQVKPEDTPTPTPAPTKETAPQPVSRPEPQPEPEPEPVPEPEAEPEAATPPPTPEPEPEPQPDPEPLAPEPALAVPETPVEPADIAPQPVIRTASIEKKRAEFKQQQELEKQQKAAEEKRKADEEKQRKADEKKMAEADKKKAEQKRQQEEEQKRQEEEQDREVDVAKLADDISEIINSETSRGATTGSGGTPTLGKPTGRSATLSQSEIDGLVAQIKQCLSVPPGALEGGVIAQLEFSIDGSGMVTQKPRIIQQPASSLEQALASAAQRAVMRCGPYQVASQDVRATFDPRQF